MSNKIDHKSIDSSNNKPLPLAKLLRKLGAFINFTHCHIDWYWLGFIEVFREDLYIAWYSGATRLHFIESEESDNLDARLPEELRASIVAFLEECVQSRAAVYVRDQNGFRWLVYNEDAYHACCERAGYEDSDFQGYPRLEEKKG